MKKLNFCKFIVILMGMSFYGTMFSQAIYVSPNGNDNSIGTIDEPLATLIGARDKARATGAKTIYIRGGRYNFDTTCELDSQDSGISFSGYNDEKVIFDGSEFINPDQFQIVSNSNLLDKLHNNARGKVYSQIITNANLKDLLSKSTSQISINDKMATVARYPNIGFAHVDNGTVTGEVIAENGTDSDPKGAKFKLRETIDATKWSAEILRVKKMQVKGYFSAPWYKEDILVHSVNSSGVIKLLDGSKYGIKKAADEIRRMFVYNILCELDEPGEWYYDSIDSRLYLWPSELITSNMSIGVWAGPQCFEINGAQDIQIKKMTIQNIGTGSKNDGAINVIGASRNILIAGVTFRYIAHPILAVNFWHDVRDSKVLSCDFYDIPNCSRLYGGKITSTSVEYANNSIENCHFTQIYSKDFYGKACGMSGAGNTFKNNLIHNMNGQPVTFGGVDHIIELNEAFNTNIEEGDGGVFYSGGNLWSFGNQFRHNFVHHNMSVPELHGKGAIHLDDMDAGDEVYENVFYKGGWGAVKMNMGGGNLITRNVMLECYTAIRNNNGSVTSTYNDAMNYLTTDPTSTNKSNYMGRMLKEFGISGWQSGLTVDNWPDRVESFWYDRYPRMKPLFEGITTNNIAGPFAAEYSDNMFYGSLFRDILNPSNFETVSGNQAIALSVFENPSALNFKFKEPRAGYAPDIPFQNIGLYKDAYRCAVPDKNTYRQKVKQRFDGQACYSNSAGYNHNTVNTTLYYNSGEAVYKLAPCLGAIEETGDDSYTIKATGETCPDKGNGQIKISAKDTSNYVLSFNGSDINFTSEWTIENLIPGAYDLCITNTATSLEQCYSFEIEAGTSVTGKTSSSKGKVSIEITKGTAPFEVLVNGTPVLETSAPYFTVSAEYGDVVEVKTSVVCEGTLTKEMDGIVSATPNPTTGNFEIALSMPLKVVTIELYNVYSQLISTKLYNVIGGKVQLDINDTPSGIYFAVVQLSKNPKTIKIIKK